MKVYDYKSFLGACVTAAQAQEIAEISDEVLNQASFVLYGRFVSGEYLDFTSKKKPGDTHCLLAYAAKQMIRPKEAN